MLDSFKKKVQVRFQGKCEWIGELKVQHVLPNKFIQAIGPFVFLEHVICQKQTSSESQTHPSSNIAHPHRGIATLTYILFGEVQHQDSMENKVKLSSGGAHWMKAGKGVMQDETVSSLCRITNMDVSVIQFWVNLPSRHKADEPNYISLQPDEIPTRILDNDSGWIKTLLGEFEDVMAKVPSDSNEFACHILLNPEKNISIKTKKSFEYAAFIPTGWTEINDTEFQSGELVMFSSFGEMIEISNKSEKSVNIILFGGEPYEEQIVTEGAFVMNTPHEISQAYNDYYDGKYDLIKHK